MKREQSHLLSPDWQGFPVDHYSYSMWSKFSSDPYMFKVNYINGDRIETTSSPASVLGSACHSGLEEYWNSIKEGIERGEAIKNAHEKAKMYLDSYSDGFIGYNTTIENRQALEERFAFAFFSYFKEVSYESEIKEFIAIEQMLKYTIDVGERQFPVPITAKPDIVYFDKEDRVIIRDHKFSAKFSDEDAIDGAKLIQAGFNYFDVYCLTGKPPYAIYFDEVKVVKNREASKPQMRSYKIVYEDNPLIFDLFYRFYEDITDALLGKQVFIPNINAMFDKEVAIVSYIHKLDVDFIKQAEMKKAKITNITDLLKKKISKAKSMKKLMDIVNKNFISAKTLNYKDMTTEEKIRMKLMEHGISLEFIDKVEGASVTLYRYEPSVGIKMSKIETFTKDIEQVVGISGIRILAPIPDSSYVGFEIKNKERRYPSNIPSGDGFNIAIGQNVMGDDISIDIRTAPHILIAGTTGAGKSVVMSSLIRQLQGDLVLIDPKRVELSEFKDESRTWIYASSMVEIMGAMDALIGEMDRRYEFMAKEKIKNIRDTDKLNYVFVVIDEFGDIVMSNKEQDGINLSSEIKNRILILAQKGRACGIHLILTTQRPSAKIVSGDIKANFPTRICLRVASNTDSHIVIDEGGAEKLLGKGDMLLMDPYTSGLQRLQGYNI